MTKLPKKLLNQGRTPVLVLDSSTIRKHLFKGWAVLNHVAVVARSGRINLCIPWLVEQEVLSGVEKHVDDLTGQEAFLKSARMLAALSSESASIRELCDGFENLRPKICEEARSRFRHWLDSSQAERLPLKHEHTETVFRAYFQGDLPFDRPKNREHLPDAFIYQAVLELASRGEEVWFLAGDWQLRESLSETDNFRVFHDFYPLFRELSVSFDFKQQDAHSLVRLEGRELFESARKALFLELCGQTLRYSGHDQSVAPKVREVLQVPQLSIDQQSVMHIDARTLLVAFEADILVRTAERMVENRDVIDRLFEASVSIRGHFLVAIEKAEGSDAKIAAIEVDDFEVGSMERNGAVEASNQ